MIKYIPFLKAKSNETQALEELYSKNNSIFEEITPFFDIPRDSANQTFENIFGKISSFKKRLAGKELFRMMEFYVDNFDLDDTILIAGKEQYNFLLSTLSDYNCIPVMGLNRSISHNNSALEWLSLNGGKIAIRLTFEDIESYRITKLDLTKIIGKINTSQLSELHLIIDLRYISPVGTAKLIDSVERFILDVRKDFHFDKTIISGSSIPANISNLLDTYQSKTFPREEWKIWEELTKVRGINYLVFSDYGIVSPEYSDIDLDPKLFRKISAPKVFYTYKGRMLCVRGGSFQNDERGNGQYYDIATMIHGQSFFRDINFSFGEKYIYERSEHSPCRPDKAGSPSSWIKAMLTSHISFVIKSLT
ncbi:beta family protein [Pantoea sp. paga]|uniref:beta family protein n=1 Tax=Pantoea sp. paga TaxID=2597519 RepID=UPI00117E841C|nr:beta family protein [Pantoea sp. paga]TSH79512.1 hypothetical protein FOV68_20420 [Pantoea sp. paga]